MANYNTLAANVAAVVRQNGVQAITGDNLQAVILACINSLGTGYQFKGVATPATVFGSPDERLFYLAYEAGTYANMPVVTPPTLDGTKLWLFVYGSEWSASELDIPTSDGVAAAMATALADYAKKNLYYQRLGAGLADAVKGSAVAALFNAHALPFGVGNGLASIKRIKGNSIAWNQAFNGITSETINDVTITQNADGSVTIDGTASALTVKTFIPLGIIKNGRKYLLRGGQADDSATRRLYVTKDGAGKEIAAPYAFFTTDESGIYQILFRINEGVQADNLIYKPQLYDLTYIFGAGNEPTTIEEFSALFPLDIYGYAAPAIKNLTAAAIVSKDAGGNTLETFALPITTAEAGGIAIFPDGIKSVGSTCDEMTETTATKRIGSRAYQAGDESDSDVRTDGTTTLYVLETPEEYTIDTPLDLRYQVATGGSEAKSPADTAISVTAPLSLEVIYPLEAAGTGTVKNLLEALKGAGVISAYTMTYNAGTGNYDFTITA